MMSCLCVGGAVSGVVHGVQSRHRCVCCTWSSLSLQSPGAKLGGSRLVPDTNLWRTTEWVEGCRLCLACVVNLASVCRTANQTLFKPWKIVHAF